MKDEEEVLIVITYENELTYYDDEAAENDYPIKSGD